MVDKEEIEEIEIIEIKVFTFLTQKLTYKRFYGHTCATPSPTI